jgi:hypothetical protein
MVNSKFIAIFSRVFRNFWSWPLLLLARNSTIMEPLFAWYSNLHAQQHALARNHCASISGNFMYPRNHRTHQELIPVLLSPPAASDLTYVPKTDPKIALANGACSNSHKSPFMKYSFPSTTSFLHPVQSSCPNIGNFRFALRALIISCFRAEKHFRHNLKPRRG